MTWHAVIRILAAAVGRSDWGRAMLAELEEVSSPRARRPFAVGCLRALVASLPAVAAASFASGLLSLVLVLATLIRYPGLVTGSGTWVAVGFFVCVVLSYVVVAAGLAVRLVESRLTAGAVLAAVGIAVAWMAFGFSASVAFPTGLPMVVLGLGPVAALVVGWWARRSTSSPGTATQCVGLASLLSGLTLFLLWAGAAVIFAGRPYDTGMVSDFRSSAAPDLATYAVNDSLGTALMLLMLVPLVSVVAGVAGMLAATGRSRARATP